MLTIDALDAMCPPTFTANSASRPSGAGGTVLVGPPPDADTAAGLQVMRRAAEHHGITLLTALHGDALVVLAASRDEDERTARLLSPHFGAGPVVIGPRVAAAVSVAR